MGLEESDWRLWYCGRCFIGGVDSLMRLAWVDLCCGCRWVGWREVCFGAETVMWLLVEVVIDSCGTYANTLLQAEVSMPEELAA